MDLNNDLEIEYMIRRSVAVSTYIFQCHINDHEIAIDVARRLFRQECPMQGYHYSMDVGIRSDSPILTQDDYSDEETEANEPEEEWINIVYLDPWRYIRYGHTKLEIVFHYRTSSYQPN